MGLADELRQDAHDIAAKRDAEHGRRPCDEPLLPHIMRSFIYSLKICAALAI
jgi:hypothetical protein